MHSYHEYYGLVRKDLRGEGLGDTDSGVLKSEQAGLPGYGKATERGIFLAC